MKQFFTFLFLFLITGLQAQEVRCGFIDELDRLEREFPGVREAYDNQYKQVAQYVQSRIERRSAYDTIYIVPVVFHVLYNNNNENLHDSIIRSQFEILNEDYRRRNADTTETREIFKDVAGDVKIEFVLATEDPDGNSTNGINRVATTESTFYTNPRNDKMKDSDRGGVDPWDPQKYLNIWVCDYAVPGFGPFILGYAYPPRGADNWPNSSGNVPDERQGVVLHYQIVGRYNPLANTNTLRAALGRTATHEVGHYLGLRHTWGDGTNSTGCNLDDFVDDTPNERTQNGFTTCSHSRNTCNDGADDLPDQIENYMDYSQNTCQNMFTKGQIAIMRYNLVKFRPGLTTNYKLIELPTPPLENEDELDVFYEQHQNGVSWIVLVKYDNPKNLVIRNSIGQLVDKIENVQDGEVELKTRNYASGLYVVSLENPDGSSIAMEKVVK